MRLIGPIGAAAAGLLAACAGAQELPRRAGAVNETYPDVEVTYTSVPDSEGNDLRVIVTRPVGAGQFAAVFVVGWLSCDSVEAPPTTRDASGLVFRAIAQSAGFALVRMDKAGVGDSEGDCATTDFDTELAAYRAAFQKMRSMDFVDSNRVFILGISNGAGFAPLVAGDAAVAGYVTVGGWSRTWYEHMLEIERNRYVLSGNRPAEIPTLVARSATLYHEVLIKRRSPETVLAADPTLRTAWDSEDTTTLYGRPTAYYQQLQRLNLTEAWSKVRVPALVLWGQHDWIMSRRDSEGIAEHINANAPGAAQLVVVPNAGHTMESYPDLQTAFSGRPGPFPQSIATRITDWLKAAASLPGF
jgi:pimeloyl-ACP methyl ester carboxylesterase